MQSLAEQILNGDLKRHFMTNCSYYDSVGTTEKKNYIKFKIMQENKGVELEDKMVAALK